MGSGYSPGGAPIARAPKPSPPFLTSRISNHLKLKDYDQDITVLEEKDIQQKPVRRSSKQPADELSLLKVAHYINSHFKMPATKASPKSMPPPLLSPSENIK